jgi:hypothetical protein
VPRLVDECPEKSGSRTDEKCNEIPGGMAMKVSRERKNLRALSGVLFVAFFISGLVLGGVLAFMPLPMPDAPVAEAARYFKNNRTTVLAGSSLQALSAVSLFVFAACVAAFVRRAAGKSGALPRLVLGGGVLAAAFLLLSAFLSVALVPVAAGGSLGLVGTLRELNFLAGGPDHIPLLGLFVGVASIAALRAKALPRWTYWIGISAATLSLLSLTSLLWFPATLLLPLGRLLTFVWSVAVSLVLVRNDLSTGE